MCEMTNLEIDSVREKRLMVFTSLLRTNNLVSHARVVQCYNLFNELLSFHYHTGCNFKDIDDLRYQYYTLLEEYDRWSFLP